MPADKNKDAPKKRGRPADPSKRKTKQQYQEIQTSRRQEKVKKQMDEKIQAHHEKLK